MADTHGSVDLSMKNLSEEEQAAIDKMAEENDVKPGESGPTQEANARFAFTIVVNLAGQPIVVNAVPEGIVSLDEPTPDEMFSAVSSIKATLQAQQTAGMVLQMMEMRQRQMMEQAQAAQVQNMIKQKGGYRGPQR